MWSWTKAVTLPLWQVEVGQGFGTGGFCLGGLGCQARYTPPPPPAGPGLQRDLPGLWGWAGVNRVSQSTGEGAPGLVWGMPGGEGFLEESVLEPRLSSSWSYTGWASRAEETALRRHEALLGAGVSRATSLRPLRPNKQAWILSGLWRAKEGLGQLA